MHSGRVGDLSDEQLAALDSVSKCTLSLDISVYVILNWARLTSLKLREAQCPFATSLPYIQEKFPKLNIQ